MFKETVDIGKIAEKIKSEKDGLLNEIVMVKAFIEQVEALSSGYMEKLRSLYRTYKDEVALTDFSVHLFVTAGDMLIHHNSLGCAIEQGYKVIAKELAHAERK